VTPTRLRLAVAAVALLSFGAHVPGLTGDFLLLDDTRFVVKNEAVHDLTPARAVSYFTDPRTLSPTDWGGIYRPLRTLDFAVDWALSGGSPFLFHLRSVLYHVLGTLLLLGILLELAPGRPWPAVWGALLFGLHPVHVESVAWITSRADVMLLPFFLLALWLYLRGRPLAAALAFAAALFAKEAAVVFPGAVLLGDLLRRERPRAGWLALYSGMALGYAALWLHLVAGGSPAEVGHLPGWWGGSYGACLATMARGFAYYVQLLLFPVRQVLDYHVPATTGLDAGAVLGAVLLLLAAAWGWLRNRRLLFGLAWFLLTILPVSNLLFSVGIPTAERFLYLPAAGLALWGGHLLARSRLRFAVLSCLLVLTLARSAVWRTDEALFTATEEVADTPLVLYRRADLGLGRAFRHAGRGERVGVEREAAAVIAAADEFFRLFREVLGRPPVALGGAVLQRKAEALLLLDRDAQALDAAAEAIRQGGGAEAHGTAAVALHRLDHLEEAARQAGLAIEKGDGRPHLPPIAANCLNRLAAVCEREGDIDEALRLYRRSFEVYPDPEGNAAAVSGIRRTER
jgi:tetratricopeptide (TPR) repeat protein